MYIKDYLGDPENEITVSICRRQTVSLEHLFEKMTHDMSYLQTLSLHPYCTKEQVDSLSNLSSLKKPFSVTNLKP